MRGLIHTGCAATVLLILLLPAVVDVSSGKNAERRVRVSQENSGPVSLTGLKSFVVAVGPFSWKEDSGLPNQHAVETDVQLCLRRNGLPARFSEQSGGYTATEEDVRLGGPAMLSVTVELGNQIPADRTRLLVASVSVVLTQRVYLARDPSICTSAITWERVGVCSFRRDTRDVRDFITDVVDLFCNDYLAANPRPSTGLQAEGLDALPKATEPSVKQNDPNKP